MSKDKKNPNPGTVKPVPDAQAIPGIRGPKDYDTVIHALKIKAARCENVQARLTFTIGTANPRHMEYAVPVRFLTGENGETFAHVPSFEELQDANGKTVIEGMDSRAVEVYQPFKDVALGRAATPVIALPDAVAQAKAQVEAQIIATLPKKDQDAIASGKAYLVWHGAGCKVAYKRDRKSKKAKAEVAASA